MQMDDLLQYVTKMTVETTYLPPITLDKPFQPGPPNPLLETLRPKITLEIANGASKPIVVAPYGEPGESRWPLVQGTLVVGSAVLLGLGLRALLTNGKRRR